MATKAKRLGWHFLPQDMTLDYGDGRIAKVGQTLTMTNPGKPSVCSRGMHASDLPHQAAGFEKGVVLTRVEVSGDIDIGDNEVGRDKFCGRSRKVLWAKEIKGKDLTEIAKALGKKRDFDDDDVSTSQINDLIDLDDEPSFDAAVIAWAKRNGCKDVKVAKPVPNVTERDVRKVLDCRQVTTRYELEKALTARGLNLNDLDDLLSDMDGNGLYVLEDWNRRGSTAYVINNTK